MLQEREDVYITSDDGLRLHGVLVPIAEVNRLCKQVQNQKQMMKQMSGMFGGKGGKRGGFKLPF